MCGESAVRGLAAAGGGAASPVAAAAGVWVAVCRWDDSKKRSFKVRPRRAAPRRACARTCAPCKAGSAPGLTTSLGRATRLKRSGGCSLRASRSARPRAAPRWPRRLRRSRSPLRPGSRPRPRRAANPMAHSPSGTDRQTALYVPRRARGSRRSRPRRSPPPTRAAAPPPRRPAPRPSPRSPPPTTLSPY